MNRHRSPFPLAAVWLLGMAQAWPWVRVFSDRSWVVPLALAATVPVLVASIGLYRRLPALVSLVLHVGLFVVVVLAGIAAEPSSIYGAWDLMLATTLPLDGSIESTLLLVPTAVVWSGTGVAAELAVRTRLRMWVIAAPFVAFLAALAQGASVEAGTTRFGVAFLVAAVVWLVARHRSLLPREAVVSGGSDAGRAAARVGLMAWIAAGVFAVVVVGVGSIVGPLLPGVANDPTDLHAASEPGFVPSPALNPLSSVTAQHLEPVDGVETVGPETAVLEVTVPDGRDDFTSVPGCVLTGTDNGCLRLVTLDVYDGQLWSTAGEYRRSGVELRPLVPVLRADGEPRTMVIEPTAEFSGSWLPLPGGALSVDAGKTLQVDRGSGAIAVDKDALVPGSYTVEWQPLTSSATALNSTDAPMVAPCVSRGCEPGPSADWLSTDGVETAAADLFRAGEVPADARVVASGADELLRGGVKLLGRPDDPVGGHQAATLEQFIRELEEPTAEALLGAVASSEPTSVERTVALAAVLADTAGLRTRVAVGYRLPDLSDGSGTVTRGDAHAWVEIDLGPGLGWTAYDASPSDSRAELEAVEAARNCEVNPEDPGCRSDDPLGESAEQETEGGPGEATNAQSSQELDPTSTTPGGVSKAEQTVDVLLWFLAGTAGVVLAALAGTLVLKAIRRKRRRSGTERDRVLGAWVEVVDQLRDGGVPLDRAMSAAQIAATASVRTPSLAEPIDRLGREANRAAYWDAGLPEGAGQAAWAEADAVEQALRSEERAVATARRVLNPSSLVGS